MGIGAVAQLGERLNGIQEVRGSIPLGSTIILSNLLFLQGVIFYIYLAPHTAPHYGCTSACADPSPSPLVSREFEFQY